MPERRHLVAKVAGPVLLAAALFVALRLIGLPDVDRADLPGAPDWLDAIPGWVSDIPGWAKIVVVKGKFVLLAAIVGCAVIGDVWRRRQERRR